MIVSEKEYKEMWKEFNGIIFTPVSNLIIEKAESQNNEVEQIFKYEIVKTADEVYQEWLNNKDKPVKNEPSKQDILNAKLISDNAQLLKNSVEQKKLNANLLLKIAMLGGNANV